MSVEGQPIDASKGMDESGAGMGQMPGMAVAVPGGSDKALLDAEGKPRTRQLAEYVRYSGWPELKEAMIAGKLRASLLLAPMAMDLADQGVPVKIVALAHRSGAVIMVRKEAPFRTFADLKGKRIAIPSRFAVDHIFVRRLMRENGLVNSDLTMVEMPPPDMPAALLANAVDAYATGEPFGAKAEMAGYARVLYMTRDVWPTYICCVLTVSEDLIEEDPALVQTLVNYVMSAGHWLDSDPSHRTTAARIASEPGFFNQAFELIDWVMKRPADRVTYGDLSLIKSEFDSLMVLSQDAGILSHPVAYEKYVDETFMRNYTPVPINLAAEAP